MHRLPYEVSESRFPGPQRSWEEGRGADSKELLRYSLISYADESKQTALYDLLADLKRQLYLIAPTPVEAELYQQSAPSVVSFFREGLWHLEVRESQEEQSGELSDDPPNAGDGHIWDQVPTNELLRQHKSTPVKDVGELKLDLSETDQDVEAFIEGIYEARRSDTI
jgi:hypothetical protein